MLRIAALSRDTLSHLSTCYRKKWILYLKSHIQYKYDQTEYKQWHADFSFLK